MRDLFYHPNRACDALLQLLYYTFRSARTITQREALASSWIVAATPSGGNINVYGVYQIGEV